MAETKVDPSTTFRKAGNELTNRSERDLSAGEELRSLLLDNVEKMGAKWDIHLPAFLTAPALARQLWLNEVYRAALQIPGCLAEFGSQWGASLNSFLLLKQIYEPWNASRRLISFSTFDEGFTSVNPQDGPGVKLGDYAVADRWKEKLELLLTSHESRSPLQPISNFEIIAGDARETFPAYLKAHPELILSHVHFDLDVYAPTRDLLSMCIARMPKGAILVFDELNCPSFPGETVAVQEVLGISRLALRRSSFQPYSAYTIIGD